jgi:hypothetical protein
MSTNRFLTLKVAAALTSVLLGLTAASSETAAQVGSPARHPASRVQPSGAPPAPYRGLTVTRPPVEAPDPYGSDDIYVDGPIRYNDIRDFSPVPAIDSGRQFPFGFDGVGGYGSDLGYNEGQDAALYDRGAFNRAR